MHSNSRKMVAVAMFAAMGLVLQYIAFPVMPAFGFLKIDFSDVPVILSMFLFGPASGILTAFLRSFLHMLTTGLAPQNIVGDVASFLATIFYCLPIYYFFNKGANLRNKIVGTFLGVLSMTLFMSIANYFVITPLYLRFFQLSVTEMLGMPLANYVVLGILPFNLIKGGLVSAVFLVLHAKLLPWINRKRQRSVPHSPMN
ncbi:MAG: ECF transporter S component [Tetragenococcus sp.]|nr:ECF transporter S component [Tetragenococcus sp.]